MTSFEQYKASLGMLKTLKKQPEGVFTTRDTDPSYLVFRPGNKVHTASHADLRFVCTHEGLGVVVGGRTGTGLGCYRYAIPGPRTTPSHSLAPGLSLIKTGY